MDSPKCDPPLLSIIIANYNYERFLGPCIESAIAVNWENKEIIFVDDGSLDCSVEIAKKYKEIDQIILKENGGQWSAANLGFSASRGAFVIFLDSDDLLHPDIMVEFSKVYRHGVSKVQFQMEAIDEHGQSLNSTFPQYASDLDPARLRTIFDRTLSYPNAPGTSNVYDRAMLAKIFPLDGVIDHATDTYCVAAAPIYGDVVSVRLAMAKYRIHGNNGSAMLTFSIGKIEQEILRAYRRFGYTFCESTRAGQMLDPMAARLSLSFITYRVALLRGPKNPQINSFDTRLTAFSDLIRASFLDQGLALGAHLSLALTTLIILIAPSPWANRLVTWRFSPATRPKWIKRLMHSIRIGRTKSLERRIQFQ